MRAYLLATPPEAIDDSYVLALVCNALVAVGTDEGSSRPYLQRLMALKQTSSDLKLAWWTSPGHGTMFYGSGQSGQIETTALATLALLRAKSEYTTARAALLWLIQQKDGRGTWHSTQATILALKALLAGMSAQAAKNKRGL